MGHTFSRIFMHLLWSTNSRHPFITKQLRPKLFEHIMEYSIGKNIRVDSLNLQPEHVHMLVNLRPDQNVDDVAKLVKGESSHWINSENLVRPKFSWQKGYGAFSVSSSDVAITREYLRNQDAHHRASTFSEELRSILLKHEFDVSSLVDGE